MTKLEYSKVILEKVSFNHKLFSKEFYKAIRNLVEPEIFELHEWCVRKFGAEFMETALGYTLV